MDETLKSKHVYMLKFYFYSLRFSKNVVVKFNFNLFHKEYCYKLSKSPLLSLIILVYS